MAKHTRYTFTAKVWLYPGENANWHFVTVPKAQGMEISERFGAHRRGFGSLRVEVTIGGTVWHTSIFPDRLSKSYMLPIKAKVRKIEDIEIDDTVECTIRIIL